MTNICMKTTFSTDIQKYLSLVSYLQVILLRVAIRRISLNIKINFAILFDIYTISTYFVQFPPYFTIRNLFTTIEPERAQNTTRSLHSQEYHFIQLIKSSKADYEAKTPSCSCVLAGRCWSCVSAEVR